MKHQLRKLVDQWNMLAERHAAAIGRHDDVAVKNKHRSAKRTYCNCAKSLQAVIGNVPDAIRQGPLVPSKMLYAVAGHEDGTLTLTVFECGAAASVVLDAAKIKQLIEIFNHHDVACLNP